MVHTMEDRYRYYCPKVFGGWVYVKKTPRKKVTPK